LSGDLDDKTRLAISAFQATANLKPTGDLDKDTRAALVRQHGC
jgi:hypothetical protein